MNKQLFIKIKWGLRFFCFLVFICFFGRFCATELIGLLHKFIFTERSNLHFRFFWLCLWFQKLIISTTVGNQEAYIQPYASDVRPSSFCEGKTSGDFYRFWIVVTGVIILLNSEPEMKVNTASVKNTRGLIYRKFE